MRGIASRRRRAAMVLSRFAPRAGLVTLRQTFVRRCHLGWTASEPRRRDAKCHRPRTSCPGPSGRLRLAAARGLGAHRRKRRRRDGRLAHRPQPRRDHDEVVAGIAAPAAFHWLGGVAEFSVSAEADRALLVAFLAHASALQWCRPDCFCGPDGFRKM